MKSNPRFRSFIIAVTFAGAFLLVFAMPVVNNPARTGKMGLIQPAKTPRVALYGDYLYTIGVTGVSGQDNNHFGLPYALAINGTGALYVADDYDSRVQVFDNAGNYLYTIGTTGSHGSSNNQFSNPQGVAVNSSGALYVTDYGNNRVQVFDNAGNYLYTIGTTGVSGSDNSHFDQPTGVGIDTATNRVYVADSFNNRVQVFDNAGNYLHTIGGLYSPGGVAVNSSGAVYIADSNDEIVQVFSNTWTHLYNIGEIGIYGSDNGHFSEPIGVGINSSGCLYVADSSNQRVQVFTNAGNFMFSIGVNQTTGTDNYHFSLPIGVAINGSGCLYIADSSNYRVQVFSLPQPPTALSLTINGGASLTSTTSVTLTINALHANLMSFSTDGGDTWSAWEDIATTKVLNITGGPGVNTVICLVYNSFFFGPDDMISNTSSITYLPPPSHLSIIINNGATETNTLTVSLSLWANNASEMCFSNDGVSWTAWETFSPMKTWSLTGGPGTHTVYFNARNMFVALAPANSSITYILPPENLSVTINNGAEQTATRNVTLSLSATGATKMCFSNDGTAWSTWEPFASTKAWNLTVGSGYKTVYFNACNGTIASNAPVAASITYAPPALPIIWHPGNVTVFSNQTGNTLSWLITGGANSGNTVTVYRNGTAVAWGPWTAGTPVSVSLDGLAPGIYNFTAMATDNLGNTVQDTVFVTVIGSPEAPSGTSNAWTTTDSLLTALLVVVAVLVVITVLRSAPTSKTGFPRRARRNL
ncbi:MAG TPA: 6-bladed beta-propeller [Candidatus Lokiarchaeia archaeon]|nr:6-bladed beta-propeller [Candidatus Lokiarchaeia archaeon]